MGDEQWERNNHSFGFFFFSLMLAEPFFFKLDALSQMTLMC